ncbi:MAG: hypothetical protein GWO08_03150 [Gammaproteobacteria bacterium]|nr:hypothetical protein [Gammaproteobacteria bacterium]
MRKTIPDFLPPYDSVVPHWHKQAGFAGAGKTFHAEPCSGTLSGDIQAHIEGTEYRINTVSDRIVQAHRKTPCDGGFVWEWVGVQALKGTGILPTVKKALKQLPFYERSVLGWDVIHTPDRTHVLEVNTSPGVNAATAKRIVKVIMEVTE